MVALFVIAANAFFGELGLDHRSGHRFRIVILDYACAERAAVPASSSVRRCAVAAVLRHGGTAAPLRDRTWSCLVHGLCDECLVRGSGALPNADLLRGTEGVACKG